MGIIRRDQSAKLTRISRQRRHTGAAIILQFAPIDNRGAHDFVIGRLRCVVAGSRCCHPPRRTSLCGRLVKRRGDGRALSRYRGFIAQSKKKRRSRKKCLRSRVYINLRPSERRRENGENCLRPVRRSDRRISEILPARRSAEDRALSRRPDAADAEGNRFQAGQRCSAACPASWACANTSKSLGHTFVVTSDKDGPDSVFERELPDADVVISQPFWPAYLTAERIAKAKKLKLADHRRHRLGPVDLRRRSKRGITVAEVTYCNSHQRLRARRHDDPGARAQLHPLIPMGGQGRLEHRRLRRALLRRRRHARRHRRGRPHRPRRAAAPEALRHASALLPTATACPEAIEKELGLTCHPTVEDMVEGLRRRHHQRAAASGDRAPVQRQPPRRR